MSDGADESGLGCDLRRYAPLARLRERLRNRPDSEHEMAINRLVIGLVITSYLLIALWFGHAGVAGPLVTVGVFSACAVGLFVHILVRPGISVGRRVLAMLVDLGMLSWGMHVGDEVTSLLYPMYLWTIFGNGFRFGVQYLFLAMGVSVAGFSVVVATTGYWSSHLYVGGGLLGGLIILPLYAATLIRKLSAARQQAEEASRAKSLFLAGVSHELRTPLNAIIGLSELLLGSRLDAEQKEMTRTIGQSGRSLLALINSILDFARIEAGQMPKNRVDFDLYTLVFDIRTMLALQADAKQVALSVHITRRVPRMLRGPRCHLSEILMNLAANAVKFTEHGYVVVAVDVIGATSRHTRLRFEVSDTGIGIDTEAQGRIFDSFAQADETIIDRFGGTGLGLALVKQLVELHGGQVGVDSTPGVGSTFWCELDFEASAEEVPVRSASRTSVVLQSDDDGLRVLLEAAVASVSSAHSSTELAPLVAQSRENDLRTVVVVDQRSIDRERQARAGVSAQLPASAPAILITGNAGSEMLAGSARSRFVTTLARPVDAASLHAALEIAFAGAADCADDAGTIISPASRKLTILIAEDNRTNQRVIAKILERAGHQARIAENGEQAMDALFDEAFDIVLMDVNMPVMNGIETAKLYRFASLGQKRIPLLALTADASPEMEARCREAGMDGCLTKPVEPALLLAMIEQMVGENATDTMSDRVAAEGVIELHGHPKVPAVAPCALDRHVLDDLQSLGGRAFINELAAQFLADAASSLQAFETAATLADAQSFREHAHALRSAAANIGAQVVYQTCLSLRDISSSELGAAARPTCAGWHASCSACEVPSTAILWK